MALKPTPIVARQSPVFLVGIVDEELTACSPALISWVYGGPDEPMFLAITNIGVQQSDPPPPPSTPSRTLTDRAVPTGASQPEQLIEVNITSTPILPGNTGIFNWTQVTVPQGWYIIDASIPTSSSIASSQPFFVQEIGDTTCLLQSSTSSTTSPTSSGSSPTSPISTNPVPTSPVPTLLPVSGASSTINKGAIAGGVAGGGVLLILVLAIYLFFFRRSRSKHRRTPSSPIKSSFRAVNGGGAAGHWGGLSSVDSSHSKSQLASKKKKPYANERHNSQAESLGPIIPGLGPSEEDVRSYRTGGPSEEKFGDGALGMAALTSGRGETGYPSRSYSASSSNEIGGGGAIKGRRPSVGSAARPPGVRRPSIDAGVRCASIDAGVRRPSIDSPVYPPSASSGSPTTPHSMDRVPSGGSTQPQRKTPRKPVPVYQQPPSPPPGPVPAYSEDTTAGPFATPPFSPFADTQAASGHYVTRTSSKEALERSRGDGDGTTLAHKSSFGPGGVEGKPLHYLIPDMPLK